MLCVTDCPGGSYLIYAGLSTSYCVEFVSTEATCADMVASCQSAHNSEAKLPGNQDGSRMGGCLYRYGAVSCALTYHQILVKFCRCAGFVCKNYQKLRQA